MEPAILRLVLDSSLLIEAERKHQTVEELLDAIQQRFGEIEITMSAVTLAELVHGIARANTPEHRGRRRGFIDELKKHLPVHPITDATAEIAGTIGGEQAAKGNTIPDPWSGCPETLARRLSPFSVHCGPRRQGVKSSYRRSHTRALDCAGARRQVL